jgi:hypothetical protein
MSRKKRPRSRRESERRQNAARRDEERARAFEPFVEPANEWIHDGTDWMYVVDRTDGGAPIGACVDSFFWGFGAPALKESDFVSADAYGKYRAELAMLQRHLHEAQRLREDSVFGARCDCIDHYLASADIPDNEDEPDFDDLPDFDNVPDDPFDARTGVITADQVSQVLCRNAPDPTARP